MPTGVTERQAKWFASVRDGLERDTGRSLADWVAIAQNCPETAPRKRLAWFKAEHGLLQNRAMLVLDTAFPALGGADTPEVLRTALWEDPAARAILEAVEQVVLALPEVVAGQRKGYSAWSRTFQFAALRPVRGGARLGLAVQPEAGLSTARHEGWSERLTAVLVLGGVPEVDQRIAGFLRAAWQRS